MSFDSSAITSVTAMDRDSQIIADAMAILGRRIHERGQAFSNLEDVLRHAALSLAAERVEVLLAYWLDGSRRVIGIDRAGAGSISAATFSPRELARSAVLNDASWCLLVHNHPSGHPEPSDDDSKAAETMARVLASVGVLMVGCFTVAGERAVDIVTGREYRLSEFEDAA